MQCLISGSRYSRMDQVKLFKGCLPQTLLGPFLDTLTQMKIMLFYSKILVNVDYWSIRLKMGSYTSKLKIYDVYSPYQIKCRTTLMSSLYKKAMISSLKIPVRCSILVPKKCFRNFHFTKHPKPFNTKNAYLTSSQFSVSSRLQKIFTFLVFSLSIERKYSLLKDLPWTVPYVWSNLGPVPDEEVPALSRFQSKLSPAMFSQPHNLGSSKVHSPNKQK